MKWRERHEAEDLREMRSWVGKRRTLRSKKGVERDCLVDERLGFHEVWRYPGPRGFKSLS